NDPSVGEASCAAFWERYVLGCVCSGHVSRVYWWRLAAHGYGLLDVPPGGGEWRERPAFAAMAELRRRLEGARFDGREELGGRRVRMRFSRGRERFAAEWTGEGTGRVEWG
ncbi:MAG: hypothetical protein J6Y19_12430, partial [Kiritimatiellae bacterium]|nr:hypothetical protein [Kiritimatiellia bacterium]